MQIKDLRILLEGIPAEFDENEVVIREYGELTETDNHFMLDKPIGFASYDEQTNELTMTELDMFEKFKNKDWFPVNENYVLGYGEHTKKEVNEDGEGCAAGDAGVSDLGSVSGMGEPELASRGVIGSGDVDTSGKKKKKKKILNFGDFNKK